MLASALVLAATTAVLLALWANQRRILGRRAPVLVDHRASLPGDPGAVLSWAIATAGPALRRAGYSLVDMGPAHVVYAGPRRSVEPLRIEAVGLGGTTELTARGIAPSLAAERLNGMVAATPVTTLFELPTVPEPAAPGTFAGADELAATA